MFAAELRGKKKDSLQEEKLCHTIALPAHPTPHLRSATP